MIFNGELDPMHQVRNLKSAILLGTSVGGLVFPFILPRLFHAFGVEKALRALSGIVIAAIVPGIPFMRGRLPESRVYGPAPRRAHDRAWLKSPDFWLLMSMNVLQGFAFFIPTIWLPCEYMLR
jgi:MFS transporter, MCT family, solute carrier family 16 (monocarboxylic acid transporters), member 10